jgi:DNA-binding Lrp family transcriptional regulator
METGYVFLNIKPGRKREVLTRLKSVKEVRESRLLIGIFDAIAKIEGESIEDLQRTYFNKIDKIPGLISSRLHIVACPRTRK